MATSPLDPSNTSFKSDRSLGRGHGTRSLGPSDSSDSGSDVASGSAGLGDLELDADSDRNGTGERRGADPSEEVPDSADIAPDRMEHVEGSERDGEDEDAEKA